MNFGQLKTDVRRRLGDSTTAFFSNDDIENAIQDAYAELADATEFFERYANLTTIAGHTYYNLTHILPDTFLSPRRVYSGTTNRWLTPTTPRELDYHTYRQWELVYGPPEKYWMRGNWWFGIFPRTADDVPILRFCYTAIPDEFVDDSDTPAFPQEFHPGISASALSDLFSQQRETEKALVKWAEYLGYQDGLKKYVDGRTQLAGMAVL